jgi:anti-anti-sigma factor
MPNTGLNITQHHSGKVCIVALNGRVDSTTASQLQAKLRALIDADEKAILLDLADASYLTSAAFRVLLVGARHAAAASARFALCNVTGHVRDLFELGGLIESFTILGQRDEAVAKLA